MLGGWLLFLLAMAVAGTLLTRHDAKRQDERTRCERGSPPWKTAECPPHK
jgi:hypothetical protein